MLAPLGWSRRDREAGSDTYGRSTAIHAALVVLLLLVGEIHSPASAQPSRPALEIEGGSAEQIRNVELVTGVAGRDCDLPPRRENALLRDVDERAGIALRALGFYEPRIESTLHRTEACWTIRMVLDPGPPVLLGEVDIRLLGAGRDDPLLAAITRNPGLELERPVRHDHYDALRARLMRAASEHGYFDAFFSTARLEIDRVGRVATARLHLETGPRYRFGAIDIDQDILSEAFIERLLPVSRGDPYSAAGILQLQRNLAASQYFQRVQVRALIEERTEGEVDVSIRVEPRKKTAYEARIGTSTDLGPRVGLAIDRRYANLRGHRFNAELELSPRRSGIAAAYQVPLQDPVRERLQWFSSLRTEQVDDTDSDRFQIGVDRVIIRPSGWQTTTGLRFEYEEFALGSPSQTSRLLIPSFRLDRTTSDDALWPRSGYRVNLALQGASRSLGSSEDFLQLRVDGKWIGGLGSGRLLLRSNLGATLASAVDRIPASLRYFAGGDTSVRGYGYQRLGPRDSTGQIVGGRYLLVGGIEWDHPLGSTPFSGAVFLDAGNAVDELSDYRAEYGFGVGMRWRSPIGPLRLDLARAPASKDRFRLHFTMGPDL